MFDTFTGSLPIYVFLLPLRHVSSSTGLNCFVGYMYKSICSGIGVMPGVIFIHCVLHSLSQIYSMESPIDTAHHK